MLTEITAYLNRTGMASTTFGRRACGDPAFIGDLRRGREPREATRALVRKFIADHPEG